MLIFQRMDGEQWQHFNILMMSLGARQIVGNPFDRNWLPQVSSRYGYCIHPIHSDKRFHTGIDIALPTGTEILSGFDGTVTSVGYDTDSWGNFVVTGFEGSGGGQILTGYENMIPRDMFTWPLARNYPITLSFGWRIHPISGQRRHHRQCQRCLGRLGLFRPYPA